jgi:multiple sugar transport system permease protein
MNAQLQSERGWFGKRRIRMSRRRLGDVLRQTVLALVALTYLVPIAWLVITSLKPLNQVFTRPLKWIPEPIMWQNYPDALTHEGFDFIKLLGNSVFYAGLSTFGVVLSCALIAYGFARLDFWGRDAWFLTVLAVMMLPSVVTLIPTYLLFRHFGLVGGYAPLIVPSFFGVPFYIFMLRQFMLSLPWELTEAAKVDGASEFTIFSRVMLPLITPALMVVVVFNWLSAWNDFMGPLIYVTDYRSFPLSVGLYSFMTKYEIEWNLLMAAALMVTLPMAIIFFLAQRQFIEGVTLSGIKG